MSAADDMSVSDVAGAIHAIDADVVVVAHNAGDLLLEAVCSSAEQAGPERVWVMDAESTDGSVDAMRVAAIGVHIAAVPNAGFSASNNRGIEATSGAYVLLQNPDAILRPGALAALVATAEANPKAGIVGAAIYNSDGSPQANAYGRFPTLWWAIGLRLERMGERLAGNPNRSPRLPRVTTPVDWVTGAALLARRSAIQDAGMMDEAFFLYYEDIEWCHRMRDHGWDVLLEPSARVIHHLGGSAAPAGRVAEAYRASLDRYCDLYHLWGLKAFSHAGAALRRAFGGR